MKKTKILAIVLCMVLVAGISIAGTLAYLTDTAKNENTFTVGKVGIDMTEALVDEYGDPVAGATRVYGNEYKLIPGHTYTKDPTITVDAGSEDSWLFVKIVNDIAALEKAGNTTIAAQMAANGWTLVAGETDVYAYRAIVNAGDEVKVFETFTIDGWADVSTVTSNNTVTVTAYAIQADGFDTAADAWSGVTEDATHPNPFA